MMSKELIERVYRTQAAAITVMQKYPNDFNVQQYYCAIARVFAFGEVLEYSDTEIAAEMELELPTAAIEKMEMDKANLMVEADRLSESDSHTQTPVRCEECDGQGGWESVGVVTCPKCGGLGI